MMKLFLLVTAGCCFVFNCMPIANAQVAVTTTYESPVDITPAGTDHDFGKHAVTRLVDWEGDKDLDLLVGGGDGRIWLMLNLGDKAFDKPQPVQANGEPIQLGKQTTTACMVDLDGDQSLDLAVAHSDNQVTWFINEGSGRAPKFGSPRSLTDNVNQPLQLSKSCGGRMDMGDWDGDGDFDLIAGAFTGALVGYENIGTAGAPKFATPCSLQMNGTEKSYSYNVHPTVFDVNQDGQADIAYGMNWGTMGFLMGVASPANKASSDQSTVPTISTEVHPVFASGKSIDMREIAGDDATPCFGDLDSDGTLDIITGGRKGKIFWLRGVPLKQLQDRIEWIMTAHRDDLGRAIERDESLRIELMGLHHGMYRLCQGFLNTPESRRTLREWYLQHVTKHSMWLKHGSHDVKLQPYVPSVAYQVWTILMLMHDGDPDATPHRQWVANAIGFQGRLKEILVEFGTLIIENGRATPNQQETLYSYLSQIPKPLLGDRSVNAITEVITIGDYLGPRLEVIHEGGVNIFANESGKPKSSENPFPKDFNGCDNDYFGVVLAHELNHRVDATRFVAVPKYNRKYWSHMQKIAGSDVKFNPPDGIGVDWKATKKHFADEKLWDGDEKQWNRAWADYWLTGPGKSRTLNVCRNETTYNPPRYGIPFFLETRQESIASLANQYFTNSEHMLQFALDRYQRGAPGCLDEWLLMADVYSMDQSFTYLYRHRNGNVALERARATLTRNPAGHINSITFANKTYRFELDEHGLIEKVSTTNK